MNRHITECVFEKQCQNSLIERLQGNRLERFLSLFWFCINYSWIISWISLKTTDINSAWYYRKHAFNSAFLDSMRDSHDLYWQTVFAMKKDKEQNQATSIQQAIQSCSCAVENWANWTVVSNAHCKDAKIVSERDTQETLKQRISCTSVWIGGISCALDRKITGLR